MIELTDTQRGIYYYIKLRIAEGLPPTLQEIADEYGYASVRGARDHVRAIEKKGYIKIEANKARAIKILK